MIGRIESNELSDDFTTLYCRIKLDSHTQKAYNRFKNLVRERLNADNITGYGGRTLIIGGRFHVNVVRSSEYLHIVVTTDKKLKNEFLEGMQFFG